MRGYTDTGKPGRRHRKRTLRRAVRGGKQALPVRRSTTYAVHSAHSDRVAMSDRLLKTREKIMDAVFGERLTGSELLIHQAARPSKKVHYALQLVRLTLVAVFLASLLNIESRVPLIGPWMAQSSWGMYAIGGGCWAVLAFAEWHYERRLRALRRSSLGAARTSEQSSS